jgi:hypothetical protein
VSKSGAAAAERGSGNGCDGGFHPEPAVKTQKSKEKRENICKKD